MTMPAQKPGRSFQAYGTPRDFIAAVERRFGPLCFDLAALKENRKAPLHWGPDVGIDSLEQPWAKAHPEGNLWLNPPFAGIAQWAKKCSYESSSRRGLILFLTPASIGTDWFAEHVHRKAMVFALRPRLTFEGQAVNPRTGKADPFPKDLMLSVYGAQLSGFDVWKWRA